MRARLPALPTLSPTWRHNNDDDPIFQMEKNWPKIIVPKPETPLCAVGIQKQRCILTSGKAKESLRGRRMRLTLMEMGHREPEPIPAVGACVQGTDTPAVGVVLAVTHRTPSRCTHTQRWPQREGTSHWRHRSQRAGRCTCHPMG